MSKLCSCKDCRRIVADFPTAQRAAKVARGAGADRGQVRLTDVAVETPCGTLWGIPPEAIEAHEAKVGRELAGVLR